MALEILGDPFSNEAAVSVSEDMAREAAPSMPDTKVQDLIRASERETFDKQEGINEKFLLDKQLVAVASTISAELGPFALDAYEQAQVLVSASVLRLINEGDRTGSFRGSNASGGSQWDARQLAYASLEPAGNATNRVYTTGTTGDFNVVPALDNAGARVPDPANDAGSNVGNNDDGTQTLTDDQQNVWILGFYSSTNTRVVEEAKIDINDGEERGVQDVWGHTNLGTLQAFEVQSFEYINDDDNFDINGTAASDSTTDFFPFGLDIDAAANFPNLSTSA